jgi:hypothetical protein
MALSVLSQASALNQGAQLWALPNISNSRWAVKIDWYLNFQICRAQRHISRELPEFVDHVITETGLDKPILKYDDNSTLLISSEHLLPNKWVALVPLHANYGRWVQQVSETWSSLQKPSLRVFLPAGQSAGDFNELWQTHQKFEDFTIVLD